MCTTDLVDFDHKRLNHVVSDQLKVWMAKPIENNMYALLESVRQRQAILIEMERVVPED